MKRFRDLEIGDVFEFDHSSLPASCYSLEHGPWVKLTSGRYVKQGRTAITDWIVVGDRDVEVRTDGTCGKEAR